MNLIIVVIKKEFYKSIYREHGDYDVFAYKIQTGPRVFEYIYIQNLYLLLLYIHSWEERNIPP